MVQKCARFPQQCFRIADLVDIFVEPAREPDRQPDVKQAERAAQADREPRDANLARFLRDAAAAVVPIVEDKFDPLDLARE